MPSLLENLKPKPQADILSIDPGFRYLGYAVLTKEEILGAGLVTNLQDPDVPSWPKSNYPPSFLNLAYLLREFNWCESPLAIIEFPQVHRDTPNPNDIIKLSAACGAYSSILQAAGFTVQWISPREWKGNVPKPIMFKRILAKVREEEYSKIDKPKNHNVIDAVGIGLWLIKRQRN